jgi:hypothetical protein
VQKKCNHTPSRRAVCCVTEKLRAELLFIHQYKIKRYYKDIRYKI